LRQSNGSHEASLVLAPGEARKRKGERQNLMQGVNTRKFAKEIAESAKEVIGSSGTAISQGMDETGREMPKGYRRRGRKIPRRLQKVRRKGTIWGWVFVCEKKLGSCSARESRRKKNQALYCFQRAEAGRCLKKKERETSKKFFREGRKEKKEKNLKQRQAGRYRHVQVRRQGEKGEKNSQERDVGAAICITSPLSL